MKNPLTPVQILAIQALVQEEKLDPVELVGLEVQHLGPPKIGEEPSIYRKHFGMNKWQNIQLSTWMLIQEVIETRPFIDCRVFVIPRRWGFVKDSICISHMIPHLHSLF